MQQTVVALALNAGDYFEVTVREVEIDPVKFSEGWMHITLDLACEFGTRKRLVVMETVPAMVGALPPALRDAVGDWT